VPFEPLEERIASDLQGFHGFGPVRVGNQAVEQVQNDVYGSVILSVTQMFVDERLPRMGDEGLFRRLEWLGEKAFALAFEADAGPWEFRGRAEAHTYSATMCWVACDRLGQIARRLGLGDRTRYWHDKAHTIRERILRGAWDPERKAITGAMGGSYLDASVLLISELGLLPPEDERFRNTCDAIARDLIRNGRVMRYAAPDDFGAPETAFLACEFWYMDALVQIGRKAEAREMFETVLAARNHYGILSEDIHPNTGELWGNLPQTYSMAGIINTAARLSLSWEDAWARASS
jgi:GH15 family glucan-1,4-alpha-glucosidase